MLKRVRATVVVGLGVTLFASLIAGRSLTPNATAAPDDGERAPATTNGDSRLLLAQATSKGKTRAKKGKTEAPAPKPEEATAQSDTGLKFSRDIAPILVGNCIECHNPERRRGKFDMTTFQKLMTGSEAHKVIVPGKPDESHLVLHIKGEEDPKMPPGNRELAAEAITRIETWVKAGALLDVGIDPGALLKTIAPSADDRRRSELAKLSPEERDKKLEAVAKERWEKAGAKTAPEMNSSSNFVMFSNLPKDRVTNTLKVLETQWLQLNKLLGRTQARNPSEKVSVYVFNETANYIEFARTVGNRNAEQSEQAHGNLALEAPYLAATDPLAGREEVSTKKRAIRTKKGEDLGGPERSLAGLLVEQLGTAATSHAGKPPRWLSLGLGAYLASQVEPRSPYYRRLREETAQQFKLGWSTKAQEALGDSTDTEKVRAVGFSLVEWLASANRPQFPVFVRGMLEGQEKLDAGIKELWGLTREEFLTLWGEWVAMHYSRGR